MLERASRPISSWSTGRKAGPAPRRWNSWITSACPRDGLSFVHNALIGTGLRQHIKIGASGKVITAFDIARAIALGADWCNAARGFMFALGCIQSESCHTDRCPVGVATQDAGRQRALVVPDKAQRVANFHRATVAALAELVAAAGLERPSQLQGYHFSRRISQNLTATFAELYPELQPARTDHRHGRPPVRQSLRSRRAPTASRQRYSRAFPALPTVLAGDTSRFTSMIAKLPSGPALGIVSFDNTAPASAARLYGGVFRGAPRAGRPRLAPIRQLRRFRLKVNRRHKVDGHQRLIAA